jgi:hypothetical protein
MSESLPYLIVYSVLLGIPVYKLYAAYWKRAPVHELTDMKDLR